MDDRTVRDIATLETAIKESNGALHLQILAVDLSCDTKGFLVAVTKVVDWDYDIRTVIAETTGSSVLEAMEYLGRHWDQSLVG